MPSENATAAALLTIKDIARLTSLEESQLRYYESEYPERLPPKVLKGNKLFFSPEAVEAFQDVHVLDKNTAEPAAKPGKKFGRVIALTSGKGGVGKTTLALNLAIELQRLGKMCILLDADMGMANIHLLAGIRPEKTLLSIINNEASASDVITERPEGVGIIAGGNGMAALADAPHFARQKIINTLMEIESMADYILVDTGAGMSQGVRDFLLVADDIVFVLNPEITSLADGYGLLKAVAQEKDGFLSVFSIINMVDSLKQAADSALRFSSCAHKFLEVKINDMGYVLKDSSVPAAIARRTPCCIFRPQAKASRNIHNIATAFVKKEDPAMRLSSAFRRYQRILQKVVEKK